MHWKLAVVALALAQDAYAVSSHGLMARQFAQAAMMRFQCSQLVFDRIDPLVQPGVRPAAHMHQIVCKIPVRILGVRTVKKVLTHYFEWCFSSISFKTEKAS